ncbi:unnamed protein product [Hymenolepis diminuta]|uniref:Uncharacterized protein n=1 Tax=Hymenolepis diminuta TaxID=6216 RepID=A0A564Y535_HYMDI|nr:unnamed protein product [Hymenolepis diminuta]
MSIEAEPGVNIVGVTFSYPILNPRNSYVWFRQLENNFHLRCITKQKTMFQQVFPLSQPISQLKSSTLSMKHWKTTFMTHLEELSSVVYLILRRNVYKNCSHKSNYEVRLPLNFSVICDPSMVKQR